MSKILDMSKKVVLLQKPSGTIMISGNLSEYERKLYNGFLKVAHSLLTKNPDEDWFSVPFDELKQVLNLKEQDKNHNYLKFVMENMSRIKVEYNFKNKDGKVWGSASLLDNIQFRKDANTNRVIINFTIPKIVTESLKRQNKEGYYANIDLVIIRGLTSKYSILLYEIVSDYKNVEVPEFTISEFRKIFGIQNKYSQIKDIKRRILDVACNELNNNPYVDFCVSYKFIRNGRSYTHIKFFHEYKQNKVLDIKKNKDDSVNKIDDNFKKLVELLPDMYKNLKTLKSALLKSYKRYGFNYCKRNILYSNKKAKDNYRVFLIKALQDDWGKDLEDELKLEENRRKEELKRKIEESQDIKERLKSFEKTAKYVNIWNNLSEEEKGKYNNNFIEFRVKYKLNDDQN